MKEINELSDGSQIKKRMRVPMEATFNAMKKQILLQQESNAKLIQKLENSSVSKQVINDIQKKQIDDEHIINDPWEAEIRRL